MKKYRITKESLYVARKKGRPNGYGETPAAAYRDAMRRHVTVVANKNLKAKGVAEGMARGEQQRDRDAERIAKLQHDIGMYVRRYEDFKRDSSLAIAHERAEGWILMACAHFGITDPTKAVALMEQHGARTGPLVYESIERIEQLFLKWRETLTGTEL